MDEKVSKDIKIFLGGKLLGTVSNAVQDSGMGVILGKFSPTPLYDSVRALFKKYAEAHEKEDDDLFKAFFAERDRLNLTAENSDGQQLDVKINIHDFEGAEKEAELLPK